jgi:putative holliday junction resolvase
MPKVDPFSLHLSQDTYLGFDFGTKKIGVAVGQTTTGQASPLQTIRSHNDQPDWKIISQLCAEWLPKGLVVGISKQFDGSDNPVTPRMQKFCRQLEGRYQLPVYQVDEALTTYEAKQLLYNELQVSVSKLWAVQDQLAAQLILQTWLNDQATQLTTL